MRWLEELGEPVEQQEQPGLNALGSKNWSHFWETFKNSSGKGYSPSAAWASVFSPSGDQEINSRSAAQAGICLLLPQLGSAMQPPVVCSCTVPGSPGQRHLLVQ